MARRSLNSSEQPRLRMVIEPDNKFRFRYASDGGSHGGIPAKNSGNVQGKAKKTFPTIKLENYDSKKPAYIRVSLYTDDREPHVHQLVGKHVRDDGMCYEDLDKHFTATFTHLIIRALKKEDARNILMARKIHSLGDSISVIAKRKLESEIKERVKKILHSAVLCFEAFTHDNPDVPICDPLYSESISNQRSNLRIARISHYSGSWMGNEDVIILCDRVKRDAIKILFFELADDDSVIWESEGKFSIADVHYQVAISFKTPQYKENAERRVFVCLCQKDERSESVEFLYTATDHANVSANTQAKDPEKSMKKEEKLDKVEVAKEIAKDMEKWAKSQHQKKEHAKLRVVASPPAAAIMSKVSLTNVAANTEAKDPEKIKKKEESLRQFKEIEKWAKSQHQKKKHAKLRIVATPSAAAIMSKVSLTSLRKRKLDATIGLQNSSLIQVSNIVKTSSSSSSNDLDSNICRLEDSPINTKMQIDSTVLARPPSSPQKVDNQKLEFRDPSEHLSQCLHERSSNKNLESYKDLMNKEAFNNFSGDQMNQVYIPSDTNYIQIDSTSHIRPSYLSEKNYQSVETTVLEDMSELLSEALHKYCQPMKTQMEDRGGKVVVYGQLDKSCSDPLLRRNFQENMCYAKKIKANQRYEHQQERIYRENKVGEVADTLNINSKIKNENKQTERIQEKIADPLNINFLAKKEK